MKSKDVNHLLNKAEDKCIQSGTKLTAKRKLVLKQLLNSDRLLSAYDIVDRMKAKEDSVMPAMSVYRILDFLSASNLVHKIESQNKYVACRHIQCDHQHQAAQFLICQNCDCVREINVDHPIMPEITDLAENEGFQLEFSVMEFKGTCRDCRSSVN